MPNSSYNFGVPVPIVRGDRNLWGGYLNQMIGGTTVGQVQGFDSIIRQVANLNIGTTPPGTSPNLVPIQNGTSWLNSTNPDLWIYSIWDGTEWVSIGEIDPVNHVFIPIGGVLNALDQRVIGSETYTPPDNLAFVVVELVGGGGGGGSPAVNPGSYEGPMFPGFAGAGGGGGEYRKAIFTAEEITAASPITVALGTGGASNGGNGGNSTFGSLMTAVGGLGATAYVLAGDRPSRPGVIGGIGGTGGTGGFGVPGTFGGNSTPFFDFSLADVFEPFTIGGNGGNSLLGQGGQGWNTNGNADAGIQGGGGGGGSWNLDLGNTSAAGGNGYCVVTEFTT